MTDLSIQIGNGAPGTEYLTINPNNHPRTDAQLQAVLDWHKANPAAWWCFNPFTPRAEGKYSSPTFRHTYYATDRKTLVAMTVTPTGKIKNIVKGR